MHRTLLLLIFLAPAAKAQLPPHADSLWAQAPSGEWSLLVGVGGSVMTNPLYLATRLSVSAKYGNIAFRLGYANAVEFWSTDAANIISATAGLFVRFGRFRITALAGPTLVWGTAGLSYPRDQYVVAGGVVEASILFLLSPVVELGMEGQVYSNSVFTSAGAGPALHVNLSGVL